MFSIKKVPTVVSMNQEGEQTGCGNKCLRACCLPGSKLALYVFGRKSVEQLKEVTVVDHCSNPNPDAGDSPRTVLNCDTTFPDAVILAQWEDRMDRGLFRYDVTACETKVLPGKHRFIAQLNEGRHLKKRPTEFRVDQVLQAFDPAKFNFTKVNQDEVLFCFQESDSAKSVYFKQAEVVEAPNIVAINVSPIEYGHILLIPRALDCVPQRIDVDTFLLALQLAAEANNPWFRVGYNSLGAFATINHLHFQAYYLATPFPVERAEAVQIPTPSQRKRSVTISEFSDFPVRGLVFELGNSMEELAFAVGKTCMELQERNIPFNVLISASGGKVFLYPQCFAMRQAKGEVDQELLDIQVNPAVWEISGHIVLKRKEDYETASDENTCKLLAEVSLSADAFAEVKKICIDVVDSIDCVIVPLAQGTVLRPARDDETARGILKTNEWREGSICQKCNMQDVEGWKEWVKRL